MSWRLARRRPQSLRTFYCFVVMLDVCTYVRTNYTTITLNRRLLNYSEVSNNRAALFFLIFGIFTYLHGLIRDCMFIYFGKKILPTRLLETNIFRFFLQFSVLKPYLYKNMYFSSFEFMNLST